MANEQRTRREMINGSHGIQALHQDQRLMAWQNVPKVRSHLIAADLPRFAFFSAAYIRDLGDADEAYFDVRPS